MADELTESEIASMERLKSFQKVVFGILSKWRLAILGVFAAILVALAGYLIHRASISVNRYTAETRILYHPQHVAGIDSPNDKQLMSILERKSLKRKVGDRVDMPYKEMECLSVDMEIIHEKHPTTLYTLKSASQSWENAVRKANAYAEILIAEYVDYRKKDLEGMRNSLESRRELLVDRLADVDAEESVLKTRTGALSPQEALLALNTLLSDQRKNDSALGVAIANEELKKRKLEEVVGVTGPAIVANANAIRKRVEDIAAIDASLSELREKYTDLNPKVIGKKDERERAVAELGEFLKAKGVEGVDIASIDGLEKSAGELADAITRLEVLAEERTVLAREIEASEKRAAELAALIPDYERLNTDRTDLTVSMRAIDEKLNDITSVQGSLRNDLRQIEKAGGAGDKGPFGIKQIALSFGGAFFLCGSFVFAIVILELAFGNVRGGREAGAWRGIEFLGSLPAKGVLPEDEDREVMGVVSLKILLAKGDARTLLVCSLPGAEVRHDFEEALEFTETMSGMSTFIVDIVSGRDFTPPDGAEQMIGIVRKGDQGWFPAANRFAMAPTELEMLHADIDELERQYDAVFIRMEGGVRIGGTFFDQLLGISDAVLLEIGDSKTSRQVFNYARRHLSASKKRIFAIATEASAKTVAREMEARV